MASASTAVPRSARVAVALTSNIPLERKLLIIDTIRLCKSWIEKGGGNKSELAKWVDEFLGARGWTEKQFATSVIVDKTSMDLPIHKVDCYKNRIALELEWNNKDPFYDRDLNNFRLLFDLRAISVGIIMTRSDELQEIFDALRRGKCREIGRASCRERV